MTWRSVVLIAVVVTALVVFTIVANGPKGSASRDPGIDWAQMQRRYDPNATITVVWMGPPYSVTALEGTWIERHLEERFKLDLKPVFLAGADYQFKKPMMFAGGKVPDVTWEADPINVQLDAKNGFIVPIPYELILEHAPAYVRLINETAPEAWMYSYYKAEGDTFGRNLGVPTIWSDGKYPSPGLWRKDWLEKVGIAKVPETLDEMYAALKKFREEDPDGNGRKDTYGMSADSAAWYRTFGEIYGAFGAKTDTKGLRPYDWIERDGKVLWGGVTPEAKQALAMLRRWYAEELIHPDFIIDRGEEATRKFLNGKTGYLSHGAGWGNMDTDPDQPNTLINTLAKINPRAKLVPGVPPIGPNGHRGVRIWGGGGNTMVFGSGVRGKPELVIRILKMWNEMAAACFEDDPGENNLMVISKCGKRGLHYEYKDGKSPSSGLKRVPPYDQTSVAQAEIVGLYLAGGSFFSPCGASVSLTNSHRAADEVAFRKKHQRLEWGLTDVFLKPDVVPSAGRYHQDLVQLQTAVYTDIITDREPLGRFDTFVTEWYDGGGRQMTDEANELWTDMNQVYKIVGARR